MEKLHHKAGQDCNNAIRMREHCSAAANTYTAGVQLCLDVNAVYISSILPLLKYQVDVLGFSFQVFHSGQNQASNWKKAQ